MFLNDTQNAWVHLLVLWDTRYVHQKPIRKADRISCSCGPSDYFKSHKNYVKMLTERAKIMILSLKGDSEMSKPNHFLLIHF